MNKILTSIEQSKKLLELGFDISTADMYWWYSGKRYYIDSMFDDDFNKKSDIPAWSLTALLAILPSGKVLLHDKGNFGYKCICDNVDTRFHDNPIDAAFEMVCLLKENGRI